MGGVCGNTQKPHGLKQHSNISGIRYIDYGVLPSIGKFIIQ